MPTYTYQSSDGEERTLHQMPVGHDEVVLEGKVFKRKPVQEFSVTGFRSRPSQADNVKQGYYKEEQKGGPWRSGYSKKQIRQAWGF